MLWNWSSKTKDSCRDHFLMELRVRPGSDVTLDLGSAGCDESKGAHMLPPFIFHARKGELKYLF